jgi:hypothetical protein
VDDGTLSNVPFYHDVVRSWRHLGDTAAVKNWLRKGIESEGRFAAKVIKGMVSQSSSGGGIQYTYSKNPDEELYDLHTIYENAKRHLEVARDLTADERALLKALVDGAERIRAGKSPDRFGGDEE